MHGSLDATPASWRRYPKWSRPVSWLALAGALIALPFCVGIALAMASSYVDALRLHELIGWVASASDSRSVEAAFAAAVVLAFLALIAGLAVAWLRPGLARAPRPARWALIISLLDLAFIAAAVVGGWAYFMFSWSGPA